MTERCTLQEVLEEEATTRLQSISFTGQSRSKSTSGRGPVGRGLGRVQVTSIRQSPHRATSYGTTRVVMSA